MKSRDSSDLLRLTPSDEGGSLAVENYTLQEFLLKLSLLITGAISMVMFAVGLLIRHRASRLILYYIVPRLNALLSQRNLTRKHMADMQIYLLDDTDDQAYVEKWPRFLTDLMFTVVVLIWATVIAGYLATLTKSKVFTRVFLAFIVTNIVVEIVLAYVVLSRDSYIYKVFKEYMLRVLIENYQRSSDSVFMKTLNTFNMVMMCCGVDEADDYRRNWDSFHPPIYSYPLSCCATFSWTSMGDGHHRCNFFKAQEGYLGSLHRMGCFVMLRDTFLHEVRFYILMTTAVLCHLWILQLVVGSIILMWASVAENQRRGSDSEGFGSSHSNTAFLYQRGRIFSYYFGRKDSTPF